MPVNLETYPFGNLPEYFALVSKGWLCNHSVMHSHHANLKFRPELTHAEIMALPLGCYEGPIHLIRSPEQLAEALPALQCERVLGFDTETRAAFRKGESYPPSLLQFATASAVWLVQLRGFITLDGLADLLGSTPQLKAGVGLDYDLRKLREHYVFKPAGFVDLAQMSDLAGFRANGLRGLAAQVLGLRVTKQMKCTNWARTELTSQQIRYAATDAWVSREIFLALEKILAATPGSFTQPAL